MVTRTQIKQESKLHTSHSTKKKKKMKRKTNIKKKNGEKKQLRKNFKKLCWFDTIDTDSLISHIMQNDDVLF